MFTKYILFLLILFPAGLLAQIAVSSDGSLPHPSAMFEIKSTSKGALLPRMTYGERVVIPSPAQGLIVYQTNDSITTRGFYIYEDSWKALAKAEDIAGGNYWTENGINLYNNNVGNVGIGTDAPSYKLDVNGTIRSNGNTYVAGYLGIGNTSPIYKVTVTDGSFALHNSTDSKYWVMNYNSNGNYFNINEGGTARLAIANGGNVGIGTTTPSAKLDVVGNVEVTGNTAVSGTLTVQAGKGVLYNLSSSSPVKYYTREAAFTINNLGAHSLSPEASIGFIGGFSQAPAVFVADIVSNGGTAGPLYQLQLVIYDVTATNCKARLLNTSNATISQTITWNIVCMGY